MGTFVDGMTHVMANVMALEQAKMNDKVNQLDYFYRDLSVFQR